MIMPCEHHPSLPRGGSALAAAATAAAATGGTEIFCTGAANPAAAISSFRTRPTFDDEDDEDDENEDDADDASSIMQPVSSELVQARRTSAMRPAQHWSGPPSRLWQAFSTSPQEPHVAAQHT